MQSFESIRQQIIGIHQTIVTPYGERPLIYADWVASGRLYRPIEELMSNEVGPYVANTHTQATTTGSAMTHALHRAQQIIKQHVGADERDVIICAEAGMTGVVNKFQRILGLKLDERWRSAVGLDDADRPVVFVTHMEHHSNQTTWLETIAEVVTIGADSQGCVDLESLEALLERYAARPLKLAAVTAASNVTGIAAPFHQIAALMHQHGGYCFVDFACSAPYVDIDMHPVDPSEKLDAIYFSPHKFLGGPGSAGVLIFDSALYHNRVPDHPGGGTVNWTNPWHEHSYIEDIEVRESGGTPPFLQTIRAARCIQLKEEMGVDNILRREHELLDVVWPGLEAIPNLHILAGHRRDRLGVISFYVDELHFNLMVRLLNDRFGIQVRGGCSCAGTYGHYLLHVSPEESHRIADRIDQGDLSLKPGWVRLSLHPTMTDDEARCIVSAIEEIAVRHQEWGRDYRFVPELGEYVHRAEETLESELADSWFARNEGLRTGLPRSRLTG